MYLDLWLYHVVSCLETSFWRNNFVERIDEDSICLGGLSTNQEPQKKQTASNIIIQHCGIQINMTS